jgi:arylsulfatase A-like enzyme
MRRALFIVIVIVVIVIAGLVTRRLLARSVAPVSARPNVFLLTVDTLRVDHLGCYGGTAVATPNIDSIAADGALFENDACPMPMTRPSLSTVHTSQHPREHGVVNNAIALPADAVTLAEVLAAAGYSTAAFTSVRLLDDASGLAQGFASFSAPKTHQKPAGRVAPQALDWLGTRDRARPFFVWLHLFDPHLPYSPPPEYAPGPGPGTVSWRTLLQAAGANGGDVSSTLLDRALELYSGEIAYVDRWVGEVVKRLESLGVLDDTILVFTADHGECFDHGIFFEHADCLYDGAVRVPLLVRYPRRVAAGTRIERQVEHLDLAPTILSLAGIGRPPSFRGRTLLPELPDPPKPMSADAFAFVAHPLYQNTAAVQRSRKQETIRSVGGIPTRPILVDRPSYALRGETWKLIAENETNELYDIRTDPGETRNLAPEDAQTLGELRGILDGKLAQHPLHLLAPDEVNPRLRETLRALGYVQ